MVILAYKNNAVRLEPPKIGDRGLHLRIAADNCAAERLVRAECHRMVPQLWCSTRRQEGLGERWCLSDRWCCFSERSCQRTFVPANGRASPKGGAHAHPVEVEDSGGNGRDGERMTLICSSSALAGMRDRRLKSSSAFFPCPRECTIYYSSRGHRSVQLMDARHARCFVNGCAWLCSTTRVAVMLCKTVPVVVHNAPLGRQPVLYFVFAAWVGMYCCCRRGRR